ncbi:MULTISPECIES: hypothetical protein [Pseudomonadaceae]|nr:hypothetical protein [Halopseudomonas oceani]|tara:strand:- start:208 stop:603 length:396 start_codon:yes stop_codon:yes gene_type:complete
MSRAEGAFRQAFERLKVNQPLIIPKGSAVTQNNVAREAGVDPSALKKSRFPALVESIQNWVSDNNQRMQSGQSQRGKNRGLRERLASMKEQRDRALNLLANADALILELLRENERLQAGRPPSNVSPLNAK